MAVITALISLQLPPAFLVAHVTLSTKIKKWRENDCLRSCIYIVSHSQYIIICALMALETGVKREHGKDKVVTELLYALCSLHAGKDRGERALSFYSK